MIPALVVFRKELIDNLRDRRSVLTALLVALIGPLMVPFMAAFTSQLAVAQEGTTLRVPAQGAERAPGLFAYLRGRAIDVSAAPPDPSAAVRAEKADVVLVIGESYAADFQAGRPAPVRLVFDETRTRSSAAARRVQSALRDYGRQVAMQRLQARGISPLVMLPLAVEREDLADPRSRGRQLVGALPMMLLMALFMGGMYVAIDVTAGEKERGSLEALVVNPASSSALILGKLLAVMAFQLATALVMVLALLVALNNVQLSIPGMRLGLSLAGAARLFVVLLPLVPLAAGTMMLLFSRSASFKEAQSLAGLTSLVPIAPGLIMMAAGGETRPWMALTPLFSQNQLCEQILQGATPSALRLAESAGGALVLALALCVLVLRAYRPERVLFGPAGRQG